MEQIRQSLRDLLQFLERIKTTIYYTDFSDSIVNVQEGDPIHGSSDFQNYRKKVEYYLRQHLDTMAVYKLRNNKKLTKTDMNQLRL